MTGDKGKRVLIHLSSSSSSDDDDVEGGSCSSSASSGEEWESIDGEDEDADDFEGGESEKADDEEGEEDEGSFDNGRRRAQDDDKDDDISLSNRVIQFLEEMKDLHELSLRACKAYLRRHGLRMLGNKDVCIKRILDHWRMRKLNFFIHGHPLYLIAQVMYVRETLFSSRKKFTEVTRSGKLLGQRTVAGQVVKESYGATKQQHTFTIEVLWSKGIKKLPLLFPLLVKGRNLYKLKTYRQPWKDEAARRKVLAEKHRRGSDARMKRAKRKEARSTCKGLKGGRSRKAPHSTRHSPLDHTRRGKCDDRDRMASSSKYSTSKFEFQLPDLKHVAGAHLIKPRSSKPFPRQEKLILPKDRPSQLQSHHDPCHQYPQPRVGSHPRSIFPSTIPYRHPVNFPAVQYDDLSRRPFFYEPYGIGSQWMNDADSGQFLSAQRRNGVFKCSIRGCNECGSGTCVIAACWRCCTREGMRCNVHR